MGTSKPYRRLKNVPWSGKSNFCQTVGSEFGVNNMKACLVLVLQAATAVDHVDPSMTTVYRSFDVCFQQDNASHH